MRTIILASTSPRRKALLEQLGLKFKVEKRVQEDTGLAGLEPVRMVENISLRKAESIAKFYDNAVIVAADTIGVIDGKIIGKPHTSAEASAMLSSLSGRAHTVITGFTVLDTMNNVSAVRSVTTTVYIKKLERTEIEAYIKTGEPLDKAGAYGIQGKGAVIVEKIEGDYFNIVGLPLYALADTLKEFGVRVF